MSAGDFYFAINATFRFIHDTYGKNALIDYWTTMAREYHAGIAERFRAAVWRRFGAIGPTTSRTSRAATWPSA